MTRNSQIFLEKNKNYKNFSFLRVAHIQYINDNHLHKGCCHFVFDKNKPDKQLKLIEYEKYINTHLNYNLIGKVIDGQTFFCSFSVSILLVHCQMRIFEV